MSVAQVHIRLIQTCVTYAHDSTELHEILSSVNNQKDYISFNFVQRFFPSCKHQPSCFNCYDWLPLSPAGAAALVTRPLRRQGGGTEEADGGHGPGPPAGGGPAGSHPERPAKGDGAGLVSER